MARYLPNLNALRAFEAAGRLGGFSVAAGELNVTHAAISRHIQGLEIQLGTPLFVRAARGVVLTQAGRDYLARVTPALDALSKASEAVRISRTTSLSISAETTFALKWLMPRLGAFEAAHPGIDVTLESSSHLADVAGNEVDLAIRYSKIPPENLGFDLISESAHYPYAAPDFTPVNAPADLLHHKLLHEDDGTLWREWFRTAGIEHAVLPGKPKRFGSLLATEGALAGQGVVLTCAELAVGDVAQGRLIRLFDIGLTYGAYRLIYRPEALRRKPLRAFRTWLMAATAEFRPASD